MIKYNYTFSEKLKMVLTTLFSLIDSDNCFAEVSNETVSALAKTIDPKVEIIASEDNSFNFYSFSDHTSYTF